MSDPDLVKQVWKASITEPMLPDLATVRASAKRFYRQVRRRNAMEYSVHAPPTMWIVLISAIAAFVGVWLLNQRAAMRLQKRIEEIDVMMGGKK